MVRRVIYLMVLIVLSFLLGALSTGVMPLVKGDMQNPLSLFATMEVNSPGNWIGEHQIHVYNDRIILDIGDASWARFTDTNSMDPLFDIGSNALEIKPEEASCLKVGDIVSYRSNALGALVIHRIVEINKDEQGVYFVVKGDNNPNKDPEKVRFEQIQGVVVGIIY